MGILHPVCRSLRRDVSCSNRYPPTGCHARLAQIHRHFFGSPDTASRNSGCLPFAVDDPKVFAQPAEVVHTFLRRKLGGIPWALFLLELVDASESSKSTSKPGRRTTGKAFACR